MGFDCTLHVVDEALIRNEFVPRLLGKKRVVSAFDLRLDSRHIWHRVRKALKKKRFEREFCSPKLAAILVSQFAVVYCASVLPYHYERGMCLSTRYYDKKAVKKYRGNPEELFGELITVYPELEGQFPQEFEQNYCTGIYIPSINVHKLLKRFSTEYENFRGLWLILKYAEQHGLAYWEGTDLPLDYICPVLPYQLEDRALRT